MKTTLLFIFFLFSFTIQAQSNFVSSGGTATGAIGSSTFSIGQIVYNTSKNESFSTAEGLQQPFEIIPLDTEEIEMNDINLKIYPNPTLYGFYIAFPTYETENLTYILSDISGKTIRQGKVNSIENFIETDNLTSGVYILKIDKASKSYRSFKIIKQ